MSLSNHENKAQKTRPAIINPRIAARHSSREEKPDKGWRRKVYEIIFEAETPAGKIFDIILLVAILASIFTVLLESVAAIRSQFGRILYIIEWFFTILFTIEYLLRFLSVKKPTRYVFSFFGLIDLLATIPTYLSLFVIGAQSLLVIRIFRLLRVFRVFKLTRYLLEASTLMLAMRASRPKITVFLGVVLAIVIAMGSIMYLVEGPVNGFTSIPRGIYWAIVTLTTVGYGDIAPKTVIGQSLASFLMILGYAIIAVPTGIVTVELAQAAKLPMVSKPCSNCGTQQHLSDANFCRSCGTSMNDDQSQPGD
jgi:voltage-gated potassium channel